MTRAFARFTVRHGRMRLHVRVLPAQADVDAEYREGRRRRNGDQVHAFFLPPPEGAPHSGTIVLASNVRLGELVPHEVTHAVMHRYVTAHSSVDEPVATAIGLLSARIFDQLKSRGLEV